MKSVPRVFGHQITKVSESAILIPVLTITHVDKVFDELHTRTLTGVGVDNAPFALAVAFLHFVCGEDGEVTGKEVDTVANIITEIHQRHLRSIR